MRKIPLENRQPARLDYQLTAIHGPREQLPLQQCHGYLVLIDLDLNVLDPLSTLFCKEVPPYVPPIIARTVEKIIKKAAISKYLSNQTRKSFFSWLYTDIWLFCLFLQPFS